MSKKRNYTLRSPLAVYGGIRAQYVGSSHLRVWWNRRWIEMMEKFRLGARLGRGRNYAEAGQVSELEILEGEVKAVVQGVQKDPYLSSIKFKTLTSATKTKVIKELCGHPVIIARLLVGDLPIETEPIFTQAGCPLFPSRENDLTSRCNCPDWANPCKHLAAVYYLLGEEISKNPFLLLKIRGLDRRDIFGERLEREAKHDVVEKIKSEKTVQSLDNYYGIDNRIEIEDFGTEEKSGTHAPLIHRLGALPFWRGQDRFIESLEHLYDRAAARGLKVWIGEPLDVRREDEKTVITGGNLNLRHKRMSIDASVR